jgi:hypothetical protein
MKRANPKTKISFEEREPHERGFAETFRRDVVPKLAQLEAWRWTAIVACGAILVIGGAAEWLAIDLGSIRLDLFVGFGALAATALPAVWFWRREEKLLLAAICSHFPDLVPQVNVKEVATRLAPYRRLALLPPPKDPAIGLSLHKLKEVVALEEVLSGRHRGIGLWLGEGEIKEIRGSKEMRLFYGSLIEFTLPNRPGVTYRMADADTPPADAPTGRSVPIATAPFRQSLDVLAAQFGAQSVKAELEGGCVYVAMAQRTQARPLNVAGMTRSAYQCEPMIRAVLAQIAQLHRVMDALAEACGADAA